MTGFAILRLARFSPLRITFDAFRKFLDAYCDSTGSRHGGVPAEILQTATKIELSQATVKLQGPADEVATEEPTEKIQENIKRV